VSGCSISAHGRALKLAPLGKAERSVEFESPVVDDRLEDESVVAVAVKVLPAPGVHLQVMVDGLLDVLRQEDRSLAAPLDLHPRRPAPMTPDDRGEAQVSDLAHPQACPRQDEQQRVIPRAFGLALVRGVDQPNDLFERQGAAGHVVGRQRRAHELDVGRVRLEISRGLQVAEIGADDREFHVDGPCLPAVCLDQVNADRNNVFDLDLQRIANPSYNRDRGPTLAPGLRLHLEF